MEVRKVYESQNLEGETLYRELNSSLSGRDDNSMVHRQAEGDDSIVHRQAELSSDRSLLVKYE